MVDVQIRMSNHPKWIELQTTVGQHTDKISMLETNTEHLQHSTDQHTDTISKLEKNTERLQHTEAQQTAYLENVHRAINYIITRDSPNPSEDSSDVSTQEPIQQDGVY